MMSDIDTLLDYTNAVTMLKMSERFLLNATNFLKANEEDDRIEKAIQSLNKKIDKIIEDVSMLARPTYQKFKGEEE